MEEALVGFLGFLLAVGILCALIPSRDDVNR